MSVVYKSERSVTENVKEKAMDASLLQAKMITRQMGSWKKRSTVKGIHQCAKAIAKDYKNKLLLPFMFLRICKIVFI